MFATSPNNTLEEDKKIILVNCIEINIPRICDENQTTGQFNVSQLLLNPIDTVTTQKMKFSIKDFFSKCDQILNGKLHFFVQCVPFCTFTGLSKSQSYRKFNESTANLYYNKEC